MSFLCNMREGDDKRRFVWVGIGYRVVICLFEDFIYLFIYFVPPPPPFCSCPYTYHIGI